MKTRTVFPTKRDLIHAYVDSNHRVLDVGFSGQGIQKNDPNWPHALLKENTKEVYGIDLEIDRAEYPDTEHYQEGSAETFSFPGVIFDVIFAGDLIEHLPNPGQFLAACKAHMNADSKLILTTPNAFNLFNIAEKFTKDEPTVNPDHTCYFNHRTLKVLLAKCGLETSEIEYVYSLEYTHTESWKKKFLNVIYRLISQITPKFTETLVVVSKRV